MTLACDHLPQHNESNMTAQCLASDSVVNKPKDEKTIIPKGNAEIQKRNSTGRVCVRMQLEIKQFNALSGHFKVLSNGYQFESDQSKGLKASKQCSSAPVTYYCLRKGTWIALDSKLMPRWPRFGMSCWKENLFTLYQQQKKKLNEDTANSVSLKFVFNCLVVHQNIWVERRKLK